MQKIYEQNVYESSDDKFLKELFEDINTPEEAEYVLENIDYLFDLEEGDKGIGKLVTGLKNSKQLKNIPGVKQLKNNKQIQKAIKYLENIGRGAKNQPKVDGKQTKEISNKLKDIKNKIENNPTVTGSKTNIKPNDKVTSIVKSNKKDIVKGDGTKVKGDTPKVDTKTNVSGVDKIKDAIKNNPGKTAGAGVVGTVGTAAGINFLTKDKKDDTPKVDEKPKDDTPKVDTPKVDTPKVETKKEKPKRLSSREKMRKRNEILHGKDHVDRLRQKNKDFQRARNKKDKSYTMDDFASQYKDSQTAKRRALKKLGGPEAFESYNPIKDYHTANDLAEVYRNMYNTSSEQETIMELSPARSKRFSPGTGPKPDKKMEPDKPSKPAEPLKPNMGSDPVKGKDPVPNDKGNDPVPPTTRDTAPTEPKRPAPQRPGGTNKKAPAKPAMRREDFGYDAYDLILEYLLGTEQVDTIEEANYVMTEMDQQTIHDIVLEMEDALNQIDEGMMGNAMSGATRGVTSGMANTAKSVGGMVGTGLGGASSMLLKGARKAAELLKKAPKNNPIPTGTRVNPSTSATGVPPKRMSGGGSY